MTTKSKVILATLALGTSYIAGRYTAPETVRIETKTVEVEKKTEKTKTDTDQSKHKKTVVVETSKPDGTKETTTTTEEVTQIDRTKDTASTDDTKNIATQVKEESRATSKVTVSAMVGASLMAAPQPLVYGASVSKPILGPITVGAFGLSNNIFGGSIGLTF